MGHPLLLECKWWIFLSWIVLQSIIDERPELPAEYEYFFCVTISRIRLTQKQEILKTYFSIIFNWKIGWWKKEYQSNEVE